MDNYKQSRRIFPGRRSGTPVTCVPHGYGKALCSQRVIWPLTCVRHGCGTPRTPCHPCRPKGRRHGWHTRDTPRTCRVPACGKPARLYPAGWLCDEHKPPRRLPAAIPELARRQCGNPVDTRDESGSHPNRKPAVRAKGEREMTPQERYIAAAHAMQSGVAMDMETDPNRRSAGATTPKHLRVGLNNALADQGALAWLLIAKGIFTEAEYLEAVADAAEREQARYEELLSERVGTKVTLA